MPRIDAALLDGIERNQKRGARSSAASTQCRGRRPAVCAAIRSLPAIAFFLAFGFALNAGEANALLTLGVEAGPVPAVPGQQLYIEVVASNTDATNEPNVDMELFLPNGIAPFPRAGLTGNWLSNSCTQIGPNNTCEAGETIFWQILTLEGGQSAMGTLAPVVDAGFGPGNLTFAATLLQVSVPVLGVNAVVPVVATQDLYVTLEADRSPVENSSLFDYTLHYGNRSTTTTAPASTLEFTVPAGTSFVAATGGAVLIGSTVTWALGDVGPGETGERRVILQVGSHASGTLLLASADFFDTSLPVRAAEAIALTEVDSSEGLQLGVELASDPAEPGEQLAVEVTATNRSTSAITTTTMRMRLPEGIAPFQRSQLTGLWNSSSCIQQGTNSTCEAGEVIFWSLLTLDAGQSRTGTLPPLVSTGTEGALIDFRANVTGGGDERATANTAVAVEGVRNLSVTVDEDRNPVGPGTNFEYLLHFGNRSTITTAPSAQLQLELPANTSFVSASDGGGLVGNTVQWSLGSLLPGDEGIRSATLQMGAGLVDGTLVLARAELRDTSSPAQETRARTLTEVDALDGLRLALEVAPDPADPGEQLAVELTASNRSTSALDTTTMRMRLPEGIAPFQRSQLTGLWNSSSCIQLGTNSTCEAGEVIFWSLLTLDAGQSRTGTLPPLVAAVEDGTLVQFRAEANGDGDANAMATQTVAVRSGRNLVVSIEEERNPVAPGANYDYRLHFGNRSPSGSATSAELRLTLPPDTTFVSASDGGSLSGGDVAWSLGTIDPGESGLRTATLQMGAGLPDGHQITARARLAASGTSPGQVRAASVTEVDASEALQLSLDVGPFDPGGSFSIDMTITNNSGASVTLTEVDLRIPDDIQPFSRLDIQGPWVSSTCTQLGDNATCEAGEAVFWVPGTLTAGQSVVGSISKVERAVPDGSLIDFRAVATGAGDARAEASRTVPEPGIGGMLAAGAGLLILLQRRSHPAMKSGSYSCCVSLRVG